MDLGVFHLHWTHLRRNPSEFLLYTDVWEPLLTTFSERRTGKKQKAYLMPIFSPIVTHQLNSCNIVVHRSPLYLWKSGSEHFLWQKKKKKIGWRGQLSYLAQHLRKICDYSCVPMSNIYVISLRDGITGPLTKTQVILGWFLLNTSLTSIKIIVLRTMLTKVETFIANPRKAGSSDQLNRRVQRIRTHPWQNGHLQVTPLISFKVIKRKHRYCLGGT